MKQGAQGVQIEVHNTCTWQLYRFDAVVYIEQPPAR